MCVSLLRATSLQAIKSSSLRKEMTVELRGIPDLNSGDIRRSKIERGKKTKKEKMWVTW